MPTASLVLLLQLLLPCARAAVSLSPYPRSAAPTTELYVVSEHARLPEELLCLDTLAGFLARDRPQLYRVADTGWSSSTDDPAAVWLRDLSERHGVRVSDELASSSLGEISRHFGANSFVRVGQSDQSISAGITYAAASDTPLLVASGEGVSAQLLAANLTMRLDLRGRTVADVLGDALPRLSERIVVFQEPQKSQFLSDYAVFARAASLGFGSDEPSQGALLERVNASGGLGAAFGWGSENEFVSTVNAKGSYVHASDFNKNLAALSNVAAPAVAQQRPNALVPRGAGTATPVHTVAFVISDGDNIQWTLGPWSTDERWFGSPERGRVPVGWTFSPATSSLAPSVTQKVLRDCTPNDEIIAGPSGIGYAFPTTLAEERRQDFASLTDEAMRASAMRIVNVLGQNDDKPDENLLRPLLRSANIDGLLYYSWGGGYSNLGGALWRMEGKPVVSGRYSLWGEASTGVMLGVEALTERLLASSIKDPTSAEGYSVIPVHAWSHSYADVVTVASALEKAGGFDVVLPSELLRRVAAYVKPSV